jgi:hypothetical protein
MNNPGDRTHSEWTGTEEGGNEPLKYVSQGDIFLSEFYYLKRSKQYAMTMRK